MHFCSVFGSLINSLLSVINMLLFKPFFCFILLLLHLCIFLENIYNALGTFPTGTLEDNKHILLMLLFYSLQNVGITVSWSWGDYKEYFTYKDHKHRNVFSFCVEGSTCVHLCAFVHTGWALSCKLQLTAVRVHVNTWGWRRAMVRSFSAPASPMAQLWGSLGSPLNAAH